MPTLFITGASRGIGQEFVKQYAADGWTVHATARSDGDIAQLNAIDGVTAHALDVTDSGDIDRVMAKLGDTPIDLFIANAGINPGDEWDSEDFDTTMSVNTVAPTILAQRVKPNVLASEQKKMAVLSSSLGSIAENDSGGLIPYRASKAAVNAAWTSLAIDWKDEGLTLVLLHPGWVKTDMGGDGANITPDESVRGLRERIAETTHDQSGRFCAYDGREMPW